MQHTIIDLKNVSFRYGGQTLIDKVTLKIGKADFVALLGQNGSGKTTLVKLMLGLLEPESGKITLFGKDIKDFSDWHKLAYIPQKASSIDPNFPATAREIVKLGLAARKSWPRRLEKEDQEQVDRALDLVSMKHKQHSMIGELSGGEQQRVLIARALVSRPQLLILDEPTTGIDSENQKKFYKLLSSLNELGITILLVSHDIGMISRYVNKVAFMEGKLAFYGTHHEFCHSEHYEKMHRHHHIIDVK